MEILIETSQDYDNICDAFGCGCYSYFPTTRGCPTKCIDCMTDEE